MAYKISDNCIACGACASECPVSCITAGDIYVIDEAQCISCGACARCVSSGRTASRRGINIMVLLYYKRKARPYGLALPLPNRDQMMATMVPAAQKLAMITIRFTTSRSLAAATQPAV